MTRAVAVNVGANTNEPGVRSPVWPDGSFTLLPIPESAETTADPPTYADLGVGDLVPEAARERPVHLDPAFAGYPGCSRFTYGDPHGVKARPLLDLSTGDYVFFYASLAPRGDGHPDWVVPEWGAYFVGQFRLSREPIDGTAFRALPGPERGPYAGNAHLRRAEFDAAVMLAGDPEASGLYDVPVPLSGDRGVDANHIVTALSEDSGRGPWWRRPLRFDAEATAELRRIVRRGPPVD